MGCIMSKCKLCKVEILDKTDTCPLCHHVLEKSGKEGRELYPNARVVTKKYKILENVVLFASIVVWCLLFIVDYITDPKFLWSFTVGLAIIYINVLLRLTILGRQTYMTKITWSILIGLVFLIEADVLTGYHGWGVNYAFPTAVLLWDLVLVVLMLFINRRNWQSYIIDQIAALVLCAVMMFLIWIDVITFPYYAIAAQLVTLFLFLGTVIIGDRRAREELKRRFHL